jgi:tetratricopeptide (TPR) repeat protein
MQHVENGLALDPYHSGLLSIGAQAQQKLDEIQGLQNPNVIPDLDVASWSEAEQYKLKAEFILHALQANLQVYGSNSAFSGAQPADVDLALKYINRSLELYPDNPAYLNLKALFLIEGMVDRDGGLRLLERAAELAPRDITIQDNLEKSKTSSPCFIATAAYGSDFAWQVDSLRQWRDEVVLQRRWGPLFVRTYYRTSPLLAGTIRRSESLRALVRFLLRPLVHHIGPRTRGPRWNP